MAQLSMPNAQSRILGLALAIVCCGAGCRAFRRIGQDQDSIAARRMSRQGIQAMRDGKWNTAEGLFTDALAVSATDDRAHRGLAESMWQRDERESAIKHMEQAVRLSGNDPKLVERLGRMYLEVGRLDDANEQCLLALESDRDSAQTWALRGDCLFGQGQYDDALAAYHHALALQPDYAEVQIQAAEIYRTQGRYDRVLATLDRLQENTSENTPWRADMLKGIAMRELGRCNEAMRCFDHAACKDPNNAQPYLMIASVCLENDDVNAARAAVHHAMQLNPEMVQQGRWVEHLDQHQRRLSESADSNQDASVNTKVYR